MSQLSVLCLLGVCLLAAGCAATAPSPTLPPTLAPASTTAVTVPTTAAPSKSGKILYFDNANLDVRDVPTLMALDELHAQGYSIERQTLATSALLVQALERGDADIISANTQTMWTAIAKGVNARTVVARIGSTLVLESKQSIKTCSDLDGKAVGVAATTGTNPMLLNMYFQEHCPNIKTQSVVITDNTARLAALVAGQVDAALLQSEQLVQLESGTPGLFYTLAPLYQEFSNIQINALHVRRDWAIQNPNIVKDLIRAVLTANRLVVAKPQVLYQEAASRLKITATEAKQVGDAYLKAGLWDPNGGLTAENVQYTLDTFKNSNSVPASLKLDDVADLSYLNAVLNEIGRK